MNVFLFTDTATTEIYTLSLHDALPILPGIAHPALVAEALTAAGETLPEIAEIVSLKLRRPVRPGARLDLLADGPTTAGTVRLAIRLSSQGQEGPQLALGRHRPASARP